MKVESTFIEGLKIIEPDVFFDARGFFMESYNRERYVREGITAQFIQDNMSCSSYGVTRGLHFQRPPYTQAKLVSCMVGEVWDVAVDLRKNSPTYKKWFGVRLSADNHLQFFIPQGFAHGFVALSEKVIFTYKCDNVYHPASDAGIHPFDSEINIQWPLSPDETLLSEKDRQRPPLSQIDNPF